MSPLRFGFALLILIGGLRGSAALCDPADAPPSGIRQIDLATPFGARSPWRLVVTQGPPEEGLNGDDEPGALQLCLQKSPTEPCLSEALRDPEPYSEWGPHYLEAASPIYPQGRAAPPLFEIVTASTHGGNGSQLIVTYLLKYDRTRDAVERVYFHRSGTNNNQEVRFIEDGPLKGAMISAGPTSNAPFGYWIEVSRLTPERTYRQVLRYRSATLYNDGNPLAVIDSEMPNIERHLGIWKPGSPLPLRLGAGCLKPSLKHMELWCS